MSRLITIRPKPNTKRFININGSIEKMSNVSVDGKETSRSLGTYNQEKFPGSNQIIRPIYSLSKRQFLLHGIDPANETDVAKINELAKGCMFTYPESHPKRGQYIETCDLRNGNDPFFNHAKLRINLLEGEIVLDADDPRDFIIYMSLQENHWFQEGGVSINPALSGRSKYIITNRDIDIKHNEIKRTKRQEAGKIFEALTDEKKVIVAIAMGLIKDKNTDSLIINNVLWDAVEEASTIYLDKMTKQDYFIKIASQDTIDLNLDYMVNNAINKGIIKRNKENGYILFGQPVGRDKSSVTLFMKDPKNSDVIFRTEKALDELD